MLKRPITVLVVVAAGAAFLLGAVGAGGADTFAVRLVSQTNSSITLGWDAQPGYGYLFSADGVLRSRTNDASVTSVKFSKQYSDFEVAVIVKGAVGAYPPPPAPGDTQAPSSPGNVRSAASTQTSVTVAWDPSTDNVAVTNYRVFRAGALIGQGPGSAGGFQDVWQDTGLSCGTLYQYGVDAQDEAGNTSVRATASLSTAACSTPAVACADGIDNDADGKVDLADPGCASSADTDETDNPGGTLRISGTVSASSLATQIAAAPTGPLTVQPAVGQASFTVTGTFDLQRQNVTLQHANLTDFGQLGPDANGFVLEDCVVRGILIDNADNWTIRRCDIDHRHVVDTWGNSGMVIFRADNWQVLDSQLHGHTVDADPAQHTEAMYIGAGNNGGLIQGNTFTDGGSTAHVFFTWWDSSAGVADPRNICVKGNTFYPPINPYWFVDMRAELPNTLNIDIEPAPSNTFVFQNGKPAQYLNNQAWLRAC